MKNLLKTSVALAVGSILSISAVEAAGHKEGDFILRVGAAHISPNDDSADLLVPNGKVGVDSATGLGFSGTWMLSDNWGFEVLAALPFKHDIVGEGALSGVPIGSTKHLPPTFSFQYYPDVQSDSFIPYFGVGVNYTKFFSEEVSSAVRTTLGSNDVELELDDSFGIAAQMGADWKVGDDLYFNTALWYMQIETEAAVRVNGAVATTVDVDINPWVAMVGLSWKF